MNAADASISWSIVPRERAFKGGLEGAKKSGLVPEIGRRGAKVRKPESQEPCGTTIVFIPRSKVLRLDLVKGQ